MNIQSPELANLKGSQLKFFKRLIVFLLVLFQAITVLTILFFSRMTNESVLLEQAQTILNNATKESISHTEAFLSTAARAVTSSSGLYTAGVLDVDNIERTEQYFLNQLDHNNGFAGMYLGTTSGEFIYVSRETDASKGAYRVKHVSAATTNVWWRNGTEQKLGLISDSADVFDPRERSWFKESVAEDGLIWTKPYIFFTAQKLGITAAVPVRNANSTMAGVIGVDLELEELARFLGNLNISESGAAFIADREGVLIASPSVLTQSGGANKSAQLLKLEAIADPVARKALLRIHEVGRNANQTKTAFVVDNKEYISDFMPFALAGGSKWLIGTYAAENDFLGVIRHNERRNIILALGVLLLSMVVGWKLARSAWTPVTELHNQANRDQLTQLFNRHFLTQFADKIFKKAHEDNQTISVAIVDIDHFKLVNDRFGHPVGDVVIKEVAARLQAGLRDVDVVARLGGEEFVGLLPGAGADATTRVMERIQSDLRANPIETDAGIVEVSFSVGVCEATAEFTTYEKAQQAADEALYAAKRTGRDKVVKFRDAKKLQLKELAELKQSA